MSEQLNQKMNIDDIKTIPTESGLHKIVLLEIRNEPIILFAHDNHNLSHPKMLQCLLDDKNITYELVHDATGKWLIPSPNKKEVYNSLMMGMSEVIVEKKHCFFAGRSYAYDIATDEKYQGVIEQLMPGWEINIIKD